jgi:hypothetical protein
MHCRKVFRAWVELARKIECRLSLALGIDDADGSMKQWFCFVIEIASLKMLIENRVTTFDLQSTLLNLSCYISSLQIY